MKTRALLFALVALAYSGAASAQNGFVSRTWSPITSVSTTSTSFSNIDSGNVSITPIADGGDGKALVIVSGAFSIEDTANDAPVSGHAWFRLQSYDNTTLPVSISVSVFSQSGLHEKFSHSFVVPYKKGSSPTHQPIRVQWRSDATNRRVKITNLDRFSLATSADGSDNRLWQLGANQTQLKTDTTWSVITDLNQGNMSVQANALATPSNWKGTEATVYIGGSFSIVNASGAFRDGIALFRLTYIDQNGAFRTISDPAHRIYAPDGAHAKFFISENITNISATQPTIINIQWRCENTAWRIRFDSEDSITLSTANTGGYHDVNDPGFALPIPSTFFSPAGSSYEDAPSGMSINSTHNFDALVSVSGAVSTRTNSGFVPTSGFVWFRLKYPNPAFTPGSGLPQFLFGPDHIVYSEGGSHELVSFTDKVQGQGNIVLQWATGEPSIYKAVMDINDQYNFTIHY